MNNPDLDIILRTLAEVRRTMNESGPRDTMRTKISCGTCWTDLNLFALWIG
jgi:hypothetical protein